VRKLFSICVNEAEDGTTVVAVPPEGVGAGGVAVHAANRVRVVAAKMNFIVDQSAKVGNCTQLIFERRQKFGG
jgi:hypothetical protein